MKQYAIVAALIAAIGLAAPAGALTQAEALAAQQQKIDAANARNDQIKRDAEQHRREVTGQPPHGPGHNLSHENATNGSHKQRREETLRNRGRR